MTRRTARARRGLSLLEVLVALAIFLMSITAIGHLVNIAGAQALDAAQRNEAARLCQSQLNRVLAGDVPLSSNGDTPFEENANYTWSVNAEQNSSVNGLWNVTVKVTRERSDGSKIEVAVNQMVLDPSVTGNTQDAVTVVTSNSTNSGTGSGSPSSTGSPGAGGTTGGAAGGAATKPATGGTAPKTTPSTGGTAPKTTTPAATGKKG